MESLPRLRWLFALRAILLASAAGHLAWEIAQLPLYMIWWTGTTAEVAFAIVHCTAGDVVIMTSSLVAALVVFGRGWPSAWTSFRNVMLTTIILGLGYTVYSEWLNVNVREAWVYTAWMPQIPPLGTGLSPLLQWIVVPSLVFLIVWRRGVSTAPLRISPGAGGRKTMTELRKFEGAPSPGHAGRTKQYARATDSVVEVRAVPNELFDRLDDQSRLGSHMDEGSVMMMGGRMTYEFDEAKGRATGSIIEMGGSFLGIPLFVEEVVTEREPPLRKVWETVGRPRLLIIGAYRMGFDIAPAGAGSKLRVFIAYDYPASLTGRILGRIFAPIYARWCVRSMAEDARRHFQ